MSLYGALFPNVDIPSVTPSLPTILLQPDWLEASNEIIKVSNISSGRIIEGKIINEKKILIKN